MPLAPDVPYDIGDAAFGGYVAGLIDTTVGNIQPDDDYQQGARYILIVSPNELESGGLAWSSANDPAAGTQTRWDGLSATAALVADPANTHPAAEHCDSQTYPAGDGGSQWYLPALDELELLYRHFKLTSETNSTTTFVPIETFPHGPSDTYANGVNPSSDPNGGGYSGSTPAQTTNGSVDIGSATLDPAMWSSTEAAAPVAWMQRFSGSSAGQQPYASKTSTTLAWVRPVRRVLVNNPPNAPLVTDQGTFDRNSVNRVTWTFSDPDPNDNQSAAELRYRESGTSTWTTVNIGNPNQFWDAPAGTFVADLYEAQVKTADQAGEWGPFSASFFITAGDAPGTPTWLDPINGQTVGQSSYTGSISAPDVDESEWILYADNAGAIDETTIIQGPVLKTVGALRSHEFSGLTNGVTVWWSVRVKHDGLWSQPAQIRTPVSYTPPPSPVVTYTQVPAEGAVDFHITNPAPGTGEPAVSYNDIYIRDPGEEWERRATMLAPNGTWRYRRPVSGWDPALNIRVVAVAENSTTVTTEGASEA